MPARVGTPALQITETETSFGQRSDPNLEVETNLRGESTRGYVMGSTKSREEVIERLFVGQVDRRKSNAPLVFVPVEDVVVTHGEVKEIARSDAGRIVIVIFRTRRGNAQEF